MCCQCNHYTYNNSQFDRSYNTMCSLTTMLGWVHYLLKTLRNPICKPTFYLQYTIGVIICLVITLVYAITAQVYKAEVSEGSRRLGGHLRLISCNIFVFIRAMHKLFLNHFMLYFIYMYIIDLLFGHFRLHPIRMFTLQFIFHWKLVVKYMYVSKHPWFWQL